MIRLMNEKIDNKIEKRWFNVEEAAHYLGYSKDYIHKLKAEYFIEGIHFYKKAGRVLFDKIELDKWVVSNNVANINAKDIASNVLDDILKKLDV